MKMTPIDVAAATMRCTACLTEFRPHEGGRCAGCGRPLCRVHGGSRAGACACAHCQRAAQARSDAGGVPVMPRAA
ncbi:MAG: hypothetical protein KDG52_06330 [Rhodocyclaceae bacterium]|nr:hypothetical protein [Rhodocyclaceae bacterium]